MSTNFFEKLIHRVRGRLPLVSSKLETMLVHTRSSSDVVPELALSAAPGPVDRAGEPPNDGGKGRKGGGGEGSSGDGGVSSGGGGGDPAPGSAGASTAGFTRESSPRRPVAPAAQPTLQITIGRLDVHAAPPARKSEAMRPPRASSPLADYLDRRR